MCADVAAPFDGSLLASLCSRQDVFAVLQFAREDGLSDELCAEKLLDIDFGAVVAATDALLLCAVHVPEVAAMKSEDVYAGKVPSVAKQVCAFFRVWCVKTAASNAAAARAAACVDERNELRRAALIPPR